MRELLPLCADNEQNNGVWAELHGVRAQVVRKATPPCCDSGQNAPCLHSGLLPISSQACTCHGLLHQNTTTYVWQPFRCRLLAWNASRFCERLGKKQLLFIGDSTMIQHHATRRALVPVRMTVPRRCRSSTRTRSRWRILGG